jgi:hypothetical protein
MQMTNSTANDQCRIKLSHQGLNLAGTVNMAYGRSINGANHQMSPTKESRTTCNTAPKQNTNDRAAAFDCLAQRNHSAETTTSVSQMIGQWEMYL